MEKIADENSRKRILDAAARLFANKGFDGVSVREICREAGVNVCMISYYWGGKQELYYGIIEDLIEKQTEYAETFLDLEREPETYSKKEQIDLLFLMIDKLIDFFYSNISNDLIMFLIREQRNNLSIKPNPPFIGYLRKLIANIFENDMNDKEIVYKTLFIMSQISSPVVFPAFKPLMLRQEQFNQEDIKIIKENVKQYVEMLLKEAKID